VGADQRKEEEKFLVGKEITSTQSADERAEPRIGGGGGKTSLLFPELKCITMKERWGGVLEGGGNTCWGCSQEKKLQEEEKI